MISVALFLLPGFGLALSECKQSRTFRNSFLVELHYETDLTSGNECDAIYRGLILHSPEYASVY